jgi:hypothetical protein
MTWVLKPRSSHQEKQWSSILNKFNIDGLNWKKKLILQKDLIKKTAIKIKRTKFKIKGNLRGKLIVLDWMVK